MSDIPRDIQVGNLGSFAQAIRSKIMAPPTERIRFYCLQDNLSDYVVLTNHRFIKIENSKIVSEINLIQIKEVYHRHMGLFRWDKVEVLDVNDNIETFGIYDGKVASFFAKMIQKESDNRYLPPSPSIEGSQDCTKL